MTDFAKEYISKIKDPSPMMRQYLGIKKENPEALLFFRLGDFYELFFEDAERASKALDITLTKRGKTEGQDIPMCGVPFHAAESYIARLIKKGFKVAICEQTESPEAAKKRGTKSVVAREVTRLITPGTLTEDTLLDPRQHNFLVTLYPLKEKVGVAAIDMSTGTFLLERGQVSRLDSLLERINPSEVIAPSPFLEIKGAQLSPNWKNILTPLPESRFDFKNGEERLLKHFNVHTLEGFGSFSPEEVAAAGVCLDYIELTQRGKMPPLKAPKQIQESQALQIDASTRKSLEITHTLKGKIEGSLLASIDRTLTPGGARLLLQRISFPLLSKENIHKRLDQLSFLLEIEIIPQKDTIRNILKNTPDGERAFTRLAMGRGGPRDLFNIQTTIFCYEGIKNYLVAIPQRDENTAAWCETFSSLKHLLEELSKALSDDLPLLSRDGGFIKDGYHPELDELRQLKDQSKKLMASLQAKYIEETDIPSLKIKHNNVIGFFVEVTNTHKDKIPQTYVHRQTMASAMRFSTPELMEIEQKLVSASDQILEIELSLFEDLVKKVQDAKQALTRCFQTLSEIDLTHGLASLAYTQKYVRPLIDNSQDLEIIGGRHPVVEAFLRKEDKSFVSNDCSLDTKSFVWLLTGPNMAGKSTFLRQNALMIILAQMGSFVPAEHMRFGIVDKIFSRVGASDDLARGQSTFMVEMSETALILNQATSRSFVILDEIGRGTATYDGLSIAWATLEYLHNQIECRALFATHYHELTTLQNSLPKLSCHTIDVKDWEGSIIFLHKVISGSADRSYGIHVAKLAGLPKSVIRRSEQILRQIETSGLNYKEPSPLPLFEHLETSVEPSAPSPVEKLIENMDPNTLSPREALSFLYTLKDTLHDN